MARKGGISTIAAALALLALPAAACAHLERPAYWPDPAPDKSVTPPAGGGVPNVRSLGSALSKKQRRKARIVCQADSLKRATRAIGTVRHEGGYVLRPTQPKLQLSKADGHKLKVLNRRFFHRCRYHSIQKAVNAAGNNGRVVIMPGVYTEPESRAAPTNDPRCEHFKQDSAGGSGLSYRYQWYCPNDQALINVLGRGLGPKVDQYGPGAPEDPPRKDRHGIPDNGPCVRCNLQMEGSGPRPDDVVIDAGDVSKGNGGPSAAGSAKDVALKVDRADGFVLRNVVVRHAKEHDVYLTEVDGYEMDRVRYLYAGEYGHLTFTSDHGLTQDCEAKGSGDAGVYPGGAADTGAQTIEPTRRYNQEIRFCDVHHNGQGNSGSQGNAILLDHNNFYDNGVGITVDSLYPGGHPGYPQDSAKFADNNIYSNNFNLYAKDSDVAPDVYVPVGTGVLIAGGNENLIEGNRIWDNWRRGTMLIGVPNAISETDAGAGPGSTGGVLSTSYNNLYTNNTMGIAPDGSHKPNGVDFWWDERAGNTGNRWCNNTGWNGHVTTDPILMPGCDGPSIGHGNPVKDAELVGCGGPQSFGGPAVGCTWFEEPPPPSGDGSSAKTAAGSYRPLQAPRLVSGCGATASVQSGLTAIACPSTGARLFTNQNTSRFQKTTCADWRRASRSRRLDMIYSLASAATRSDPENHGPTLVESTAYDVIQSRCAPRFAGSILLYEIYNRAASFQFLGHGL